jgi:hypothetical protein
MPDHEGAFAGERPLLGCDGKGGAEGRRDGKQ